MTTHPTIGRLHLHQSIGDHTVFYGEVVRSDWDEDKSALVTKADIETAIGFIQRQKSFLEDHLMAWVPEFAKGIIENAEYPFYPNLARATRTFLEENHEFVCTFLDSNNTNPEKPVEINSLQV